MQSNAQERKSDRCSIARDPQIARECETCACAGSRAIYCSNHRFRHPIDLTNDIRARADESCKAFTIAGLDDLRHYSDVAACRERAADTRDDDGAHIGIRFVLLECMQ